MNTKRNYCAIFCFVLLTLLATEIPANETGGAKPKSPNVIVILVDDSGFSDLGCYGSNVATPNLDSLAENGLRFNQFYNTARCWPTRAALMTGFYAQMVHRDSLPDLGGGGRGVRQKWARMIPDYLRPHGYRSYHSGKWHLDGKVLAAGFDRSLQRQNQGNFFSQDGNFVDDQPMVPDPGIESYYATTGTADHAIDCLKEHAEQYPDRPFFHYVAFIAPHFPLHALPEDIAIYRDRYLDGWSELREQRHAKQKSMRLLECELAPLEPDVGPPYDFPDALEKLGPGEINRPVEWETLTDEQKRFQATKMAIHAAMIHRIDIEVGRILNQVKSMDAFEDTLILFASDNGASAEIMVRNGGHDPNAAPGSASTYLCLGPGFSSACNTPFRRHKTWVHEGGISSPLIAHWPNGISAKNEIRSTPSHVIDILPTILDAANIERPKQFDGENLPAGPGKSLLPAFADNVTIERSHLWWMHEGNLAVRVGDWKLVSAKEKTGSNVPEHPAWELYNLASDRSETKNLIEENPEKAQQLKKVWHQQLAEIESVVSETMDAQPKRRKKKKR